ncbi:MAG: ATP-binding protein [Verrucomicrobia bacterium]|nr:ATP-binding protein [Verrucomicrobiota bacterium]
MKYLHRQLEKPLKEVLEQFPVVLITGPRQAGKSTLLQHCLKGYNYVTLDDPLIRNLAESDPALFLKTYEAPLIIDEIQYAPALLSYIKINVDANRRAHGQYVLTGSQIFPLMKGVAESLAGRIAILQLYPLSWKEIQHADLWEERVLAEQILKGFYPEFQVEPELQPKYWHSAYLSTYLERDLRTMRNIQDLGQFQRYLVLLASRTGQLFNLNEIGKECGISQTTAKDWLMLLQATSIVYLLEPYARNLTKRIVKSPKLLFVDTGLLCYLLRIESVEQLIHSPFRGHIFENMVIMEKVKQFAGKGERAPCYFYRTAKGLEIDLLIDHGDHLDAFEIKFTSSPKVEMTEPLEEFKKEYPVKKCALLNLRKDKFPFSNGIIAEHWSSEPVA